MPISNFQFFNGAQVKNNTVIHIEQYKNCTIAQTENIWSYSILIRDSQILYEPGS